MPSPRDTAAIARTLRTDSDALREAERWTRRKIYGLEDEQLRWLRDQYVEAYRQLMSTLPDAYNDDGRPEMARRAKLLADMEREIRALFAALGEPTAQAIEDGFRQGYYGRAWMLDTVTVQEWNAQKSVVLPSEAIRALLAQDYLGVDDWIDMERGKLIDGIKRSLSQSMIQGEGMAKGARRLRDTLGVKPGQTSGFKGSMYHMLLITRTEIMRASNLGALSIYEQNADVLRGWEWVSTLDERTCPKCGGLDGKTFAFDSPQLQPPSGSHPGCRCTVAPWLRDQELLDRSLVKPRELYSDWAARQGFIDDGGLDRQRGAGAHGLSRTQ